MKRYPSRSTLAVVSIVCVLMLAACNSAPTLRYITISPQSMTIAVTTTQQYTALAYYSDGTVKDGSSLVSWSSSDSTVAAIDAFGVATAIKPGTVTITATAAGTSGATATLNVNLLTKIDVTPNPVTVAAGNTEPFTATGTFKNPDGSTGTSDVTSLATWTSSDTTVATIDDTGLATGKAATGSSTIKAELYGISGTATLTAGAPVPVSLTITPAAPSVPVGGAVNFTAQEKLSDGTMQAPTGTLTWTSATASTATILSTGVATAVAAGTSVIKVTEGTLTPGTTTLTAVAGVSHVAFVANQGGALQSFTVDATSATAPLSAATAVPTAAPLQNVVQGVVHPAGKLLFVLDIDGKLHILTIGSAGALTDTGTSVTAASSASTHVTIDPYGRFIYVSDGDNNTIYGFTVNQSSNTLTAIAGTGAIANLNTPEDMVIDPTGAYMYVTNNGADTVSAYSINQSTGALAALSTPTYATGSMPAFETFDPSATHLFVANAGGDTVTMFPVGTGGALGTAVTTTITGAVSLTSVTVAPSGNFIYIVDQDDVGPGTVYAYSLSGGTIGTTALNSQPTGIGPSGVAIDPTGKILTINNNSDDTISTYTIDSTGKLTPTTPATVAADTATWWTTFLVTAQ